MNQNELVKAFQRSHMKRVLLISALFSMCGLLLPSVYAQTNKRHTSTVKKAAVLNEAGVKYLYNTWVKALKEKDVEMWQKITSSYQQRKIRNELVSKRRQFPLDVFSNGISNLISLDNLEMVSLTQNNISAKAVFFGDLEYIQDMPSNLKHSIDPIVLARQSLYFIDFLAEAGWWKIQRVGVLDLRHQPELKNQLLQYRFEPIQLPVPRQLPELPPLVSPADYIGNIWVEAQGSQVDLEVNGVKLAPVADSQVARLILGGLKLGKNVIKYRIQISDSVVNTDVIAAIEVFALSEKRGNKPIHLWSLQKQRANEFPDKNGFYTSSFELTREVAKDLNIE